MPVDRDLSDRPIFLTRAGRERLRRRIEETRNAYLEVCASNGDAAQAGDSSVWHDNFAYEENQRQMHHLARRVRDLEERLARARIVPARRSAPEHVQLGAAVRLRRLDDRSETTWFIAGFDDGDPDAGRISYTAPLARALIGAVEGDVRVVTEGAQRIDLEVLELLPAPSEEQS